MKDFHPKDKQQIIKLFKSGIAFKDIQKKFKSYTRQQLAAIKAHVTIGTFKHGKLQLMLDHDKNLIIKLGRKGLNSKQILEKIKFHYSPQQVAGVLAHI